MFSTLDRDLLRTLSCMKTDIDKIMSLFMKELLAEIKFTIIVVSVCSI